MSEADAVALLLSLGWREQQWPLLVVDDGLTTPTFFAEWAYLPVYTRYFPIVFHKAPP